MACSGCKLEYKEYINSGLVVHGTFNVTPSGAFSPPLHFLKMGGGNWGYAILKVTNGASHGACASGLNPNGEPVCVQASPCSGVRGVDLVVYPGYTLIPISTDANTHIPFNCGDMEHLKFIGMSGTMPISNLHELQIICGQC